MKKLLMIPFLLLALIPSVNSLAYTQGEATDLAEDVYDAIGVTPTQNQLDEIANIIYYNYQQGFTDQTTFDQLNFPSNTQYAFTESQVSVVNSMLRDAYYAGLLDGPNSDSSIAQAYSDGFSDGSNSGATEVFAQQATISHVAEQIVVTLSNGEVAYFPETYATLVNFDRDGLFQSGYQTAVEELQQQEQQIFDAGYAQGQLDSESDTTAIATFIPQILSLGFGFFFQIFSIEVMGVTFLQWFAAIAGVAMSFVLFKAILK